EDHHRASIDRPVAGDDTVARDALLVHAEVDAAVIDEHVPLFEGVFVQQHRQALARRQLPLGMLRIDAPLTAAEARLITTDLKFAENFLHLCSPVTTPGRAWFPLITRTPLPAKQA